MEMISESTRSVSELLSLLDLRSKQVDRLIATVRKDRDEMFQVKSRVAGLVNAATHFARKGACLSLKAIGRGQNSRKLAQSFAHWRRQSAQPSFQLSESSVQKSGEQSMTERSGAVSPEFITPASPTSPSTPPTGHMLEPTAFEEEEEKENKEIVSEDPIITASSSPMTSLNDSAEVSGDKSPERDIDEEEGSDSELNVGEEELANETAWQQVVEESSGDAYWWNRATDEVTWDTPQEIIDLESKSHSKSGTKNQSKPITPTPNTDDEEDASFDNEEEKETTEEQVLAEKEKAVEDLQAKEKVLEEEKEEERKKKEAEDEEEAKQAEIKLEEERLRKETEEREKAEAAAAAQEEMEMKEALRKAAELAKENVLKKLKDSQERLEQSKQIAHHQENISVPGIVTKLLRKVDTKLQEIVLKCGRDASTCKEGLKQWNSLKNELLFNLESENDVNVKALELSGVVLDEQEIDDIKQSNLIATHVIIEVVTIELSRLMERFMVKHAQPISDTSGRNSSSEREGNSTSKLPSLSSLFNRLPPSPLLEAASKPLLKKNHGTTLLLTQKKEKEEVDIVVYVSKLVKQYCSQKDESCDEKLGKKKKQKKGGGLSPRPVNHPVLSSPLVLTSSGDFHPKNSEMLGELSCTARLADGLLSHLLDEIIIEMNSSINPSQPSAAANDSSTTSGNTSADGLLSQWKQSIEQASSTMVLDTTDEGGSSLQMQRSESYDDDASSGFDDLK